MKYTFIIPFYGEIQDYNLKYTIDALLQQRFRDFEIIISGTKVFNNTIQYINNIKITNIVNNINQLGKLMNEGIKIAEGDFIHVWTSDLVIYEDYLECLNEYISKYGEDNLYAGHLIDVRGLQAKQLDLNDIYFKTFDIVEGHSCCHKKHCELFREEFEGFITHWAQEHCFRLFKKMKFICMSDVKVIHIPHPMRISNEDSIISSQKSFSLFEKMKRGEM